MQIIYQDDVIEITEPYIGAYPVLNKCYDTYQGTAPTVKELIDGITTAAIELHKAGERWYHEGETIADDIGQMATALEEIYNAMERSRV
jgi:hypothetical protein